MGLVGSIDVGGVCVQILCEGDAIMRMMANGKQWEPQTRAIWSTLVETGKGVIDVGAYTGVYAIASAMMGASVTAIEPHPINYRRLRDNAAINSVKMKMLCAAASDGSDSDGFVRLRMKREDGLSDTASLIESWPCGVHVRAVRIDELRLPAPTNLIKIDVERYETRVLAGARGMIMQFKPLVLVECLNVQAAGAVDAVMETMSYTVGEMFDNRNRLYWP
jgi:FkbM family methyltransferase